MISFVIAVIGGVNIFLFQFTVYRRFYPCTGKYGAAKTCILACFAKFKRKKIIQLRGVLDLSNN